MINTAKILIILTSHATLGSSGQPTGLWLEEFTTPYYAFMDAGVKVDVASVAGNVVPVDPHSIKAQGQNPASVERYLKDPVATAHLKHSIALKGLKADGYSAIFLPGGHGTMWDLPNNQDLATLLGKAWADGKVLSAVCHGPAGLVSVKDEHGKPLVAGRHVTAFSNSEEKMAGLDHTVPFALETRLRELGAHYESGPDFAPYAVRDGRLVTGQNPASSKKVAELVLQALSEQK